VKKVVFLVRREIVIDILEYLEFDALEQKEFRNIEIWFDNITTLEYLSDSNLCFSKKNVIRRKM
jgi:hypothetical protein